MNRSFVFSNEIFFSVYQRFVTLETDARALMMNIMMQLRTRTLGGEYVMARLKASSTSMADVDPYHPVFAPFQITAPLHSSQGSEGARRKKKKSRTKKNRNKKFQSSSSTGSHNASDGSLDKNSSTSPAPPSLSVDQFPSLLDEKKVEWETPPGDGRDPRKIMPMGGYAAALLKPAPAKVGSSKSSSSNHKAEKSKATTSNSVSNNSSSTSISVKPKSNEAEKTTKSSPLTVSGWGQRRSFADILRQDKVDAAIASS